MARDGTADSTAGGVSTTDGVIEQRVTAERDEAFVVFHVGMRVNAFWKLHRWLPILLVAPRMVRELLADEESGLLDSRTVVGPGLRHVGFVQYWESFDALREYARDGDRLHRSAWREFYRDSGGESDGDGGGNDAVGIWHETYLVTPDAHETVYNNVPAHGLAACEGSEVVPASGERDTATGRLRQQGDPEPTGDANPT